MLLVEWPCGANEPPPDAAQPAASTSVKAANSALCREVRGRCGGRSNGGSGRETSVDVDGVSFIPEDPSVAAALSSRSARVIASHGVPPDTVPFAQGHTP